MKLVFALVLSWGVFSLSNVMAQDSGGCGDPEQDWKFVGCSYSPSECYYSCPSLGEYKAEKDPQTCWEPGVEWACYCPKSLYKTLDLEE